MRQALDAARHRPTEALNRPAANSPTTTQAAASSDQMVPDSCEPKRKDSAQENSAASSMVDLGVITVYEEDDAACVKQTLGRLESTDSASTEDAILQVLATTLHLLRSGQQSALFRSCAEFVKSAQK